MSSGRDYTQKYKDLRANFLAATDRAYSTGYEHGLRDAAQQQMQQQQEQQAQMQAAAMQGQVQDPMQDEPQAPEEMGATPDVADQMDQQSLDSEETDFESALNELEQLLGAGPEVDKAETAKVISQIAKSLSKIKEIKGRMELRKSLQFQPMNKSERLKTLHKKVRVETKAFQANVKENQKQALSMQKKMVNSLVEKMRSEETSALDKILNNLKKQGITD